MCSRRSSPQSDDHRRLTAADPDRVAGVNPKALVCVDHLVRWKGVGNQLADSANSRDHPCRQSPRTIPQHISKIQDDPRSPVREPKLPAMPRSRPGPRIIRGSTFRSRTTPARVEVLPLSLPVDRWGSLRHRLSVPFRRCFTRGQISRCVSVSGSIPFLSRR